LKKFILKSTKVFNSAKRLSTVRGIYSIIPAINSTTLPVEKHRRMVKNTFTKVEMISENRG